ncbi:MAG: GntR family transcriptional regulator [Pseudomonadota bacterium]
MTMPVRPYDAYAPATIASRQVAEIVEALRRDIVSAAIPPGAPLGQEALAARFGVSRMPVREAIRHLEAMGFAVTESNKRTRVAELSREDLIDIYEMRAALEPLALRAAIPHLTNAQIDEAAAIQASLAGADALTFGQLNQAFHMTLYRPSGRARLLAQVDALFNAADRYLCIAKSPPGQREKSDREHEALLEACRLRDVDGAAAVLLAHIGDARGVFEMLDWG